LIGTARGIMVSVVCAASIGVAQAQDSKSDHSPASDEEQSAVPDVERPVVERCFNAAAVMDTSVFSDQHVYVRTRGGNHYVVTTEHCENLQRRSRFGDTRLVPYGRTVCQGDGSYILYNDGARDLPCQILGIERVNDRTEARAIAEGDRPVDDLEEILPPE
jgi:hypothetical protein